MKRAPKPVLSQAEGLAEGLAEKPTLSAAKGSTLSPSRPKRSRRTTEESLSPSVRDERFTVHEKERFIFLGRLVNTHGVRGQIRLFPYHFPCPTLRNAVTVFLRLRSTTLTAYRVEEAQPHKLFILLKLEGVDSMEAARALVSATLAVKEQDLLPLAEEEFYHYQVIGMEVITTSGTRLGTIKEVFFTGSHDVWVIRQGEKEHLIPVIDEVVRSLDIPGKKAIVEPLEGLLD
jgi:16S rRNA processing protein RimM